MPGQMSMYDEMRVGKNELYIDFLWERQARKINFYS
ncbi:MAG: hypothetical protein A4E35_00441 [Methanoregula sp. PtaU1.Bin051]|nr:MAG: hypothetical protein A4E35_00441 [Methanoregula sp. PtaU1.Bin051]